LGDARTFDNDSPQRAGLSIDELGYLSIDRDQREQSGLSNCRESKTKISYHTKRNSCNLFSFIKAVRSEQAGAVGFKLQTLPRSISVYVLSGQSPCCIAAR